MLQELSQRNSCRFLEAMSKEYHTNRWTHPPTRRHRGWRIPCHSNDEFSTISCLSLIFRYIYVRLEPRYVRHTFKRLLTLRMVNRVLISSKIKVFVSCPKRPGWLWYLDILVFSSKVVLFYPAKSGLSLRVTTPRNVQSSSIIRRPALPLLCTYNDVCNYVTSIFTNKWLNLFTRRCRENIRLTVQTVDKIPLFSHIK